MNALNYSGPGVIILGCSATKNLSVSADKIHMRNITAHGETNISSDYLHIDNSNFEDTNITTRYLDCRKITHTGTTTIAAHSIKAKEVIATDNYTISGAQGSITNSSFTNATMSMCDIKMYFCNVLDIATFDNTRAVLFRTNITTNSSIKYSRILSHSSTYGQSIDVDNSAALVSGQSAAQQEVTLRNSGLVLLGEQGSQLKVDHDATSSIVCLNASIDITADSSGKVLSVRGNVACTNKAPVVSAGTTLSGNAADAICVGAHGDISAENKIVVGGMPSVTATQTVESSVVVGDSVYGSVSGSAVIVGGSDIQGAESVVRCGNASVIGGSYAYVDGVGSAGIGNDDYSYIDLDSTTLQIATQGYSWLSWNPPNTNPRIYKGVPFTL